MQVVSRASAGRADIGDDLTLFYFLTVRDGNTGSMGVKSRICVVMLDFYMVAPTAAPRISAVGNDDNTICRRKNWSSRRTSNCS